MKKISLLLFMMAIMFASNTVFAQQWGLYTLYATKNGTQAYLIDTSSTTYHTWTFTSNKTSVYSEYLAPGDTLYRSYKPTGNTSWNTGPCHGGIQKILWDGTVVWDYNYYLANSYCPHHDICPMPNGNVILICYEVKSVAEATQAGASSSVQIYAEKLIEVHPTGATTGTIVWEWHLWDHLCQNYNSSKDNYVTSIVDNPQLLNINYLNPSNPDQSDRWHMNGIDYNADLNQIVVSMHFMNSAFVIDHSTTTAEAAGNTGGNSGHGGDFLYRWGNPASYGATGTTIFNVVHDAHWVPGDNPNYPNYLAGFNNNSGSGNSKVDIWNPPYNGYNYTLVAGSAYGPSTYDYEFTSAFTSNNEGNSQQLPNGNMLVNNSFGSIYEVNSAGTNLWTKSNANSSHAYRYTKCYVRGPVATAGVSISTICLGDVVTLNSSATSVTESSPTYTYSWSSSPAGFTSTSQNPLTTPSAAGTYTYLVTITNSSLGCSDTASVSVVVDDCTGLDETSDISDQLNIFPNPTTGIINFSGSETENHNFEIRIYNTYGNLILLKENKTQINLSDFNNGLYFLQIKLENKTVSRKILLMK